MYSKPIEPNFVGGKTIQYDPFGFVYCKNEADELGQGFGTLAIGYWYALIDVFIAHWELWESEWYLRMINWIRYSQWINLIVK